MSGYSTQELLAMCVFDLEAAESSNDTAAHIKNIIAQGTDHFESRHRRKDGSTFDIEISVHYKPAEGGQLFVFLQDITERNRIKKELWEKAERFKIIFEYSKEALMTLDPPALAFTSGNPTALTMFGAKNEAEFISCEPAQLSPTRQPDGRASADKAREMIETAMRQGVHVFNWTHKRLNGTTFPAEVHLAQLKLGEKMFLQATVRDLTERMTLKEMRAASLYNRTLIETSLDPLVTIDGKGKITDTNKATMQVTGLSREELIGTDFSDHFTEPDKARDGYRQVLAKGFISNYPLTIRHKNGRLTDVIYNATPYRDEKQNILGVFAAARDITERKQIEEMLLLSEMRYRTLFESAKDGILILNAASGKIIDVNPFMMELLGYSIDEFLGKELWELGIFKDMIESRESFQTLKNNGYVRYENMPLQSRTGHEIAVEFISNVYDIDQQKKMIQCNIRDITQRKQAEDKVKAIAWDLKEKSTELENANKELEAFSYSAAHDLRAPLRSILGFSQILSEDYHSALDAKGQETLGRICNATRRMAQLIDDMLSLSRVTMTKMDPTVVDLSKQAEEIADELKKGDPHRKAEFIIKPGMKTAGDETLLRALLMNLLANAWKFTSKHPAAKIEFSMTRQAGKNVYFVRDDGAGFDASHADRLFGPFQRLHSADEFEGSGIGLSIARRIVRRHKGDIWTEAAVEKGATFYFTMQNTMGAS